MLTPPNLQEASQFLLALSPDSWHTFQTIDDTKSGCKGITRTINGTFESKAELLASANENGAGVFVLPNKGNGKGRKACDIVGVRFVFVDLDGAPLEPVQAAPIPPTIIVETSPNKYHAYWPVTGLSLDKFKPAQQALAAMFNGDMKVCDLPRVMRIPGFYHRKDAPFLSRLRKCESVPPYDWQGFVKTMGLAMAAQRTKWVLPATIPEGDRNNRLYGLAYGLRQQGIEQSDGLSKLAIVNAERCTSPVSDEELGGIVKSAWAKRIVNFAAIPKEVLLGPVCSSLSCAARSVLLMAYANYNGANNGQITLTNEKLRSWRLNRKTASRGRKELIEAGLLEQTKKATSFNPKPAFFKLTHVWK